MDTRALPDGPTNKLWLTLRYLRDPEGTVLSLARRYGDPFTVPTLSVPMVVTGAPDAVRAVFSADPDTFAPFAVEAMEPILGRGSILLQHGAQHRRARRLMQPPFQAARIRAYGATMHRATLAHLETTPFDEPFPIEEVLRAISLEVIVRTVFGVQGSERIDLCRRGVLDALAAFSPLLAMFQFLRKDFRGFGPWSRFRRLLGGVHALLLQEIAARRGRAPGDDILSLLVAARDEDGTPLADDEIVEQLFTMVVAGHETTATALAWAVDEVYRDAALLERLHRELRALGGDPEGYARSALLDAVCAETLRLHPLAPMLARKLLRPLEICGRVIPAGIGVGACLLIAHRRPEAFPEPERFHPDRFVGKTFSPQEYFPFGGGARRCLGAAFALYEMKIVLGTLLASSHLELASAHRARPGARAATVGPRGGVPVVRTRAARASSS